MTSGGSPPGDRRFARDVARHIDRRRVRRRLTLWTALLGAIAAAAMYLRCGSGLGLGPGAGTGNGVASRSLVGRARCALRVMGSGIVVDGKPMTPDQAVAACKAIGGAEVVVTGDSRYRDWPDLEAALHAAGVTDIIVHEPPVGSAAR